MKKYCAQAGSGQRFSPGHEKITDEADHGIKRRVAMRLFTGKGPEPADYPRIKEQIEARTDLGLVWWCKTLLLNEFS